MFIQKLRLNGRFSFSSTQTTPTLRIAAMRAFSSAGRSGISGTRYGSGIVETTASKRRSAPADAHADDAALVADRDAEHRLDAGRELDRAAERLQALGDLPSSSSEPPSM
jgi:hypothetical protein